MYLLRYNSCDTKIISLKIQLSAFLKYMQWDVLSLSVANFRTFHYDLSNSILMNNEYSPLCLYLLINNWLSSCVISPILSMPHKCTSQIWPLYFVNKFETVMWCPLSISCSWFMLVKCIFTSCHLWKSIFASI